MIVPEPCLAASRRPASQPGAGSAADAEGTADFGAVLTDAESEDPVAAALSPALAGLAPVGARVPAEKDAPVPDAAAAAPVPITGLLPPPAPATAVADDDATRPTPEAPPGAAPVAVDGDARDGLAALATIAPERTAGAAAATGFVAVPVDARTPAPAPAAEAPAAAAAAAPAAPVAAQAPVPARADAEAISDALRRSDAATDRPQARAGEPGGLRAAPSAAQPDAAAQAPQGAPQLAPAEALPLSPLAGTAEAAAFHKPAAAHASLVADPRAVAGQLAVAVANTDDSRIEIRLDPPELGRVHIHLTAVDGGIQALVAAQRPETQDFLRRHAETLAEELAAAGYGEVSLDFAAGEDAAPGRDERPPAAWQTVGLAPAELPAAAPVPSRGARGALDIRL